MRKEGWANQGYYPTPPRVVEMTASQITFIPYRKVQTMDQTVNQCRILDPCCGEGLAVERFREELAPQAKGLNFISYGLEINRERSSQARQRMDQVWNADIEQTRVYQDTCHILWLNPPYDWDADPEVDATQRLESRFLHKCTPALVPNGLLVYIIPVHVMRHDARFLAEHYEQISAHRFPDPEFDDYRQAVIIARKRTSPVHIMPGNQQVENLERMSRPPNLPRALYTSRTRHGLRTAPDRTGSDYMFPPMRVLRYSPAEVLSTLDGEGLWHKREMSALLDTEYDTARIRPLEKLPPGHAAMAAANSMVDNALIPGETEDDDPIIVRGFFRKRSRETMRTEDTVVRTDHFESNIRAMNARTGDIEEVGSDPNGLKRFMDTYGPAIRQHIDLAYPPAIDLDNPECQAIRERIQQLHRPLIGKQLDAATLGAAHLRDNPHLNMFFTQGSGKTCTAYGVAHGLRAAKVAVITPTRVIPNWADEIRAVWPDAIVRVVDTKNPIGDRRPTSQAETLRPPTPFARASLEEIRRLECWATPETPLWVLFKKDSARTTYPTQQGLRWVGGADRPPSRPLANLAEAERRISDPAAGMSSRAPTTPPPAPPSRLFRDQNGRLLQLDREAPAIGVCPQCWFPLTTHDKWNPRDRNAVCLNERPKVERSADPAALERLRQQETQSPTVRGRYGGTWLSMDPDRTTASHNPANTQRTRPAFYGAINLDQDEDEDGFPTTPEPFCGARIAHAARNDRGKAIYSYGDYASRYMRRWFDLFIIDEAQDYKARETAQGETTRRMAQRSKKTISLTGTPFGGKVSELFYLMAALHPGFNELYTYRELSAFRRQYGREETTYHLHDDGPVAAVGSNSRRRETKASSREIPGYHPALLEMFWENTIFMDIQDVDPDRELPTLTQRAHLLPMDDAPQKIGSEELSQMSAYEELDDALTTHVKSYLQQGSRRPLSQYLQETLTYPENCWQGAEPTDPITGEPIIVMPPLDAERLYPKERALVNLLHDQRKRGRRCLVYCTHTSRRDTTGRLMEILQRHGFRALQLRAGTVDSEQRTAWLSREAGRNDVIVCHPKLVETGVNLLEYPTIVWFEIEYSMFTTEQASARSYRINQRRPVEVHYLAYQDTMQERALRLIARKADVSRTFHGDLSKNGLSAFNPDPDDIREQLARELLNNGLHNGYVNGHPDDDLSIDDLLAAKDLSGTEYPNDVQMPQPVVITKPAPTTWTNEGARQLAMLFD